MSTTSGIGFSVITPAYRTERYVAETIESVLRQTRADWELIVVDNGPSDEMARIVESYMSDTRIRLIRQDNNGIGGARNVAAREAHGRYLTCLDSDDQLLPAYFAEVGQILDRRPDVAMVSCDALVFLEEKGRLATQTYLKGMRVRTPALDDPEHVLANLLSRNFIYAGATVRRSTLEAIGGFAEDLPGLEDWDTWLRVAGTRQGIAVVGQPLAIYRHRSDSASRNTDRLDSFELTSDATLVRALECLDLSGEQRRIARRGLADIRAHRALRLAREALLAGDDQLALEQARLSFSARRNPRSGLVLGGLQLSPTLMRRLHRPKNRFQGLISDAQERLRRESVLTPPRPSRRPAVKIPSLPTTRPTGNVPQEGDVTFSILSPAFGTESWIAESIHSVLAQTRRDWELIIIDDCSPDNLSEVARAFEGLARIRIVRLGSNVGPGASRNYAASVATGRYFTVLDSDDLLAPNYLERVGEILEVDEPPDVVGVPPVRFYGDGRPSRVSPMPEVWGSGDPEAAILHMLGNPFNYHGTTITREAFEAVGGYDPELRIGEDHELWVRIATSGYKIRVVDEPLYFYRIREGSLSFGGDNASEVAEASLRMLERIAEQTPLNVSRRAALDVNVRASVGALDVATMRRALRTGDRPLARRSALKVIRDSPRPRNLGVYALTYLPGPAIRTVLSVTGRGPLRKAEK